jgi:F-type H+-transporting ATPase subunit b
VFQSFIGVDFWTALAVLINTLLLYYVLKKFLFVPVMKMIEERQAEIDGMYLDAANARENALSMESEYKDKLSVAAETGANMVKEAVARGQLREEEIIRQANVQASAILEKASQDIALEKKKAINDAKDEISGIAMSIAEKVVGRELNGADHAALVDSFIDRLGDQL